MTPSEIKRKFGIDVSTIRDKPNSTSIFDEVACDNIVESCDLFEDTIECIETKKPEKCTIPGDIPNGTVINNITIVNKASNYILVNFSELKNQGFIGGTLYQNDILINCDILEYIIINNTIETKEKGDFSFDSVTGTLNRQPNKFTEFDILIINYNK